MIQIYSANYQYKERKLEMMKWELKCGGAKSEKYPTFLPKTKRMMQGINNLKDDELREELFRCCGSHAWVECMMTARPFQSDEHLRAIADKSWWSLPSTEWLYAFLSHPRIGDVDAIKEKYNKNPNSWEGGEQSGADNASDIILNQLKLHNDMYYDKFGHVFLICATGKNADEMLHSLNLRINNNNETELLIATGEQAKITHLRLTKLIAEKTRSKI
jgi:2-oxo-4-hydroxy-4-carboxy-5-ureidoimidazoline decarboxylase